MASAPGMLHHISLAVSDLTRAAAFYDAVGDPERQAANARTMFESVQRFIDLSAIDVIPTSRYDGPG